ncbi:MAG: metallophosphoesterase [Kurthia sp.]|nr:metallophosphoesterase [Candidatus Kurthia equi]
MKKISIIVLVFLLYNVIVFYLGWNVYSFLHDVWNLDRLSGFSIIWGIFAYSILFGRISHSFDLFKVIGYYWVAFLQYGLLIFPLTNIVIWLVNDAVAYYVEWVVALVIICIFIIGIYRAYSPIRRYKTIEVANKEKCGQHIKIIVGSDFHFGPVMGRGQLEKFVQLSNQEEPDLVLLAGDIVDDVPYWYIKNNMKDTMKRLTATYGVYGILGNHEYYGKKIKETVFQMEQSNVLMLLDETIEIPGICMLTGREDITNKARKNLADLKSTTNLPWLVMDHTPADLETPALLGVDLQVSGHTHRGQMWPNQWITQKAFPLDYGYLKKDTLHAVTTSGFGFWGPPLRTNSRAELWVIEMKFV